MIKRFSRRVTVGIVGVLMLVLSIAGAASASAQVYYPGTSSVGYGQQPYGYGQQQQPYGYGQQQQPYGSGQQQPYGYGQPVSQSGYPPNAVISSYFDPRYCGNGAVSVVTDAGGALIDICTSTGQRILPIYPDFSPYGGFGGGYSPYSFGYRYR